MLVGLLLGFLLLVSLLLVLLPPRVRMSLTISTRGTPAGRSCSRIWGKCGGGGRGGGGGVEIDTDREGKEEIF